MNDQWPRSSDPHRPSTTLGRGQRVPPGRRVAEGAGVGARGLNGRRRLGARMTISRSGGDIYVTGGATGIKRYSRATMPSR